MRCPFCNNEDTQVKDSRPTEDGSAIRRRRHCPDCGGRFTTFERVQLRELQVVKRSGRRVPFDRDKLDALGPDRAAQAPGRSRSDRAHGLGHRAAARKHGRDRNLRPKHRRARHGGAAGPSTTSPMCASPRSIAISAKPRISRRCWVNFPATMTARRESADRHHMAHALRVGRRALGVSRDNPPVGCLIVKDGQVVGSGANGAGRPAACRNRGARHGGRGGAGSNRLCHARAMLPPWPHPALHRMR